MQKLEKKFKIAHIVWLLKNRFNNNVAYILERQKCIVIFTVTWSNQTVFFAIICN